jgi:hypothetical protein
MSYIAEWDDKEKGIIFTALEDPWTWDDFIESYKAIGELAQTVDYDVYMIADMRMTLRRPTGGFRHKRQAVSHLPKNLRANIMIGFPDQEARLDVSLGQFLSRLVGVNMEMLFVESTEEAYQLIEELRKKA